MSLHTSEMESDPYPDQIVGEYQDDFDIVRAHQKIRDIYARQKKQHRKYYKNLKKQLRQELAKPHTLGEKKEIEEQLQEADRQLEAYKKNQHLNEYWERVKDLVHEYERLGHYNRQVVFGKEVKDVTEETEKDQRRRYLIRRYLEIAGQYFDVNVRRIPKKGDRCESCGNRWEFTSEDEENGIALCPHCNHEIHIPCCITDYESSHRADNSSKDYDDWYNFYDKLLRFQGKKPINIPAHVYERLDRYFQSYGYPTGDVVRQKPLNEDGTKPGTSWKLMEEALADTGNSAYYPDINLLCHRYWGWTLPDFSHLEDAIKRDYDQVQEVYRKLKGDRKSSMGVQFRMYFHLRHRGCNYPLSYFRIAQTDSVQDDYREMASDICGALGWKSIDV